MTKDEALKLALEALEIEDLACRYEKEATPEYMSKAITAIKQALAAPVQEPVKFNEELHQERERRQQLEAELMRMQGRELKLQMALNAPAVPAPVQEPVAWMYEDMMGLVGVLVQKEKPIVARPVTPLYTTPPYVATPLAAPQEIQRLNALVRAQQITIDKLEELLKEKNCD
jgi:hypothetical protein